MSRVFLLLNDPLLAARLRSAIDAGPELEVCGWVATLEHARVQLERVRPDLVLADLQLADGPFASLLDALCHSARYGRPKSLLLADSVEHPHLLAAMRHGADNYVPQARAADGLITAVQRTLRGEADMSRGIAQRVLQHFDSIVSADVVDAMPKLTTLERQVLQALADGYADHDIASGLRLSSEAIGLQVRALYRKLQFASAFDAPASLAA